MQVNNNYSPVFGDAKAVKLLRSCMQNVKKGDIGYLEEMAYNGHLSALTKDEYIADKALIEKSKKAGVVFPEDENRINKVFRFLGFEK